MARHANDLGFEFEYPDGWRLVEEPGEDRHALTVSPDDTTFWSVTLLFDRPAPDEMLDAVVAAFQDEYGDVDVHASAGKLAGRAAKLRTLEFVCWDLTNTAVAAAARFPNCSLLVISQFTDSEEEEVRPVLQAITQSLQLQ